VSRANAIIDGLIGNVRARLRSYRLAWSLVLFWILAGVLLVQGLLPSLSGSWDNHESKTYAWVLLAGIGGLLWFASRLSHRDSYEIAKRVEAKYPSLEQRLLTTLEPRGNTSSEYLQQKLIRENASHANRHGDWLETLPAWKLRSAWGLQTAAMVGVIGWGIFGSEDLLHTPFGETPAIASSSEGMTIEPGNIELERGSDLLVTARFGNRIPESAQLIVISESGEQSTLEMTRALSDSLFGAAARRIERSFQYSIQYDGQESERFSVNVYEHPTLTRSDATITPPEYANQEVRTVEDTRKVTVVEGSNVKWSCRLNKEVSVAELVDEAGVVTHLKQNAEDSLVYETDFDLDQSQRWKLRLMDRELRASKLNEELTVRVLENKVPDVKLAGPMDQNVSPIQEVMISAKVQDDFGLMRTGVSYSLGSDEPQEIVLQDWLHRAGEGNKGESQTTFNEKSVVRKVDVTHILDLESMHAEADQLLSYHFWTEDLDRDGSVRRIDGEMYFAEIRPFEELFRQGDSNASDPNASQQQPSGSSPAAQQAEELGEVQKKIVAATWNVLRSIGKASDASLGENRDVLIESQSSALEQSQSLQEKIQDQKSKELLRELQQDMEDALQQLRSIDKATLAGIPLRDALKEERNAYEGLLKLRAREHNIVQQEQQQSQSQSQSASQRNRQQQIDQLKLDNDEQRFERESRPEEREPETEREMRQVMNRLDELARRQKDLNETLRELDVAIQAVKDPEEKKKLEEELKRLRDEQQEMLRDADELLDRMNQERNRDSMEESRQQMERAREQMQQSAQSLSRSETSPAIASGAKAQQSMEETREELRQQSSEGLRKSMNDLIDRTSDLEKRQSELDRQLREEENGSESNPLGENPSALRSASELADAKGNGDAWKNQREQLNQALEKIQETISESESSEPLLADELYETFRKAKQAGIDQRLEQIPKMLDRGLDSPAREASGEALEAIRDLKEQIKGSAASVLGSEEESLRRALRELDQARDWLASEQRAKDPNGVAEENSTRPSSKPNERWESNRDRPENGDSEGSAESVSETEQEKNSGRSTRSTQSSPATANNPDGSSEETLTRDDKDREQGAKRDSRNPNPRSGKDGRGSAESGDPIPDLSSENRDVQGTDGSPTGAGQRGQPPNQEEPSPNGQGSNPNRKGNGATGSSGGALLERIAGEREFVAPLTGEDFSRWTDAIRDVEELVRDPDLRAEAARIREAAREIRIEYKRHSKDPEWPIVRRLIAEPLDQLRERISEELIRKSAKQNEIVPIDRDPVPNQFQNRLDRYYERLGSGRAR